MALRDKKDLKKVVRSFGYAFEGLIQVIKTETNMQIHVCASIVVLALGAWCQLSAMEWIIVLLLIAGMFSLELINTAIEKAVDLITKTHHPLAKHAKDAAAAAVLIYACFAVVIGIIIFGKYLLE
ncbi:diacylglycerol kinase family protein [Priestia megaterium]|nr:diacylglycerol kinase family protein [Priestia megaterium]